MGTVFKRGMTSKNSGCPPLSYKAIIILLVLYFISSMDEGSSDFWQTTSCTFLSFSILGRVAFSKDGFSCCTSSDTFCHILAGFFC